MKMSIFKEENGLVSMRRVLAFVFAIASIVCGVYSIVIGAVWQVVLVAFGVPIFATILLLFFTTWTDVSEVINAIKK